MVNYFSVLGVSEDAEIEVIKASYKAFAKKYHPDNTKIPKEEAESKMQLLNEAYDVLVDDEKRRCYIEELHRETYTTKAYSSEKQNSNVQERKPSKEKKPFYKKVWFWIVVVILFVVSQDSENRNLSNTTSEQESGDVQEQSNGAEMEMSTENMVLLDLGIFGSDFTLEDLEKLEQGAVITFKGEFLEAENVTAGANLLYTEYDDMGEIRYIFFVDMDDPHYERKGDAYGYIKEEIARYANDNYSSSVTEEIIESYVEPRFFNIVAEKISGEIFGIDKQDGNYYVCYLENVTRISLEEEMEE